MFDLEWLNGAGNRTAVLRQFKNPVPSNALRPDLASQEGAFETPSLHSEADPATTDYSLEKVSVYGRSCRCGSGPRAETGTT